MAQLARTVPPEDLFVDYAYFSSASQPLVEHGFELVQFARRQLAPEPGSLVVEIGSNDGYLLDAWARAGHRVLGIDPARNIVAAARERGVPTLEEFFTSDLARRIRNEHGPASVVHANNVLAHVPGVLDVLSGLRTLVEGEDGALIIETAYIGDIVTRGLFDTVYHEHVYYYSFTALRRLLERAGFTAVHVEPTDSHGGSLRVVAKASPYSERASVGLYLEQEARTAMCEPSFYEPFVAGVTGFLARLRSEFESITANGHRLAGFGAAAKASIMVAATDAPLTYVCDSTPHKQGKVLPGTTIPIVEPEHLLDDQPEYCVILAWNYAEAIVEANRAYLDAGGTFIMPVDFDVSFVGHRHGGRVVSDGARAGHRGGAS